MTNFSSQIQPATQLPYDGYVIDEGNAMWIFQLKQC